ERYGELRRIENRYNGTVNRYFLCDRGRFGYGYVNLKDRPRQPVQRRGDDLITLNAEQAMQGAADILRQSKKVIGIGSPRASIESNFALRELVGADNFYTGIAKGEQARLQMMLKVLREGGIHTPSLRDIESYDAVLVLGEDITQTGARVALAVRQAVKGKAREMAAAQKVADWQIAAILNIGQRAKHPLFVTNVDDTRLDDIAAWTYRAPVEDQARLGFAIAHALDDSAPAVDGLSQDLQGKVDVIVQALAGAKKPLIISGTNAGSMEIIQAAANVAKALKGRGADVGVTMVARAVNSVGLGMIGGGSLEEALDELESGAADAVIVLENDLHRHASAARVDAALAKAPLVMVVDHQRTAIMDKAHLVLSAASFAESDGTVVNNEGRAQRFFQVYDPAYYDAKTVMLESWRWLHSLHSTVNNRQVDWTQLDHVIDAAIAALPQLAGIKDAAPDATFRIRGQKLAREPHRYSGRTAMRANISVHEPRQPQDKDTMFAFSMEGNNQPSAPRSQIPFAWAPGWNSPQAWNKFQDEVGGKLRHGDPGVRLFEASASGLEYFTAVPASFQAEEGKWRIAPYYHLFGSDELSQRAPVFQSRMPEPYIKLNPADAAKLGVNPGAMLSFSVEGQTLRLPLVISEGLTAGQVGLPMGMPGIAPVLTGSRIDSLQEAKA
ncbi:TPA: molybdopterin-dependent oxidoreductase, partial [Klebsiella pneumoniae]|nr:NADH-quinone oxidoreductase subunit NuoG [Klebsiella pneumoniae]EMA2381775.1 NADH-quinone oxidoreductase subunit NuoG [Klebsiella pneumoniae]